MKRDTPRIPASDGQACVGYALGAAAFAAGVQRFSLINALAQGPDYKALVCVFLAGGNDGNNMVVPTSTTEYKPYAAVRAASGLAIARDALLPITPRGIGSRFRIASQPRRSPRAVGRAEALGRLQRRPASRADDKGAVSWRRSAAVPAVFAFRSGGAVADGNSDRVGQTGWGGRTADGFGPHGSGFPMITALSGGIFTRGQTTTPLAIAAGADGPEPGTRSEWFRQRRPTKWRADTRWTSCGRWTPVRRSSRQRTDRPNRR